MTSSAYMNSLVGLHVNVGKYIQTYVHRPYSTIQQWCLRMKTVQYSTYNNGYSQQFSNSCVFIRHKNLNLSHVYIISDVARNFQLIKFLRRLSPQRTCLCLPRNQEGRRVVNINRNNAKSKMDKTFSNIDSLGSFVQKLDLYHTFISSIFYLALALFKNDLSYEIAMFVAWHISKHWYQNTSDPFVIYHLRHTAKPAMWTLQPSLFSFFLSINFQSEKRKNKQAIWLTFTHTLQKQSSSQKASLEDCSYL